MAPPSVVQEYHRAEIDTPCRKLPEQAGPGVTLRVGAGQTIVIEGDPIDHYFRILTGTVRLYKAVADGRRQIIDFLGPEECFGLTGLDEHAYSVEAITDVVMSRHPRQRLDSTIEAQPDLGRQLLRLACSELNRAQQCMFLLGRKSAEERVASFLLDLGKRQGDPGQDMDLLHLAMSRQDIADHLGLTIETVSRIFTRFRRAGLIDLPDRHSVTLNSIDRLSMTAEGDLVV
ncbi:MAG: helix-turn-helix domain-containing protein [Geminicoccaceae bacterium]